MTMLIIDKPKALDTYCCSGGASRGLQLAGFHVTGVDINPQPKYIGDEFIQGDAVEYIREHGREYVFIANSPPCQKHTKAQRIQNREHPDLISSTREALEESGVPYVIENVPGSPLKNPVELCMTMFGLENYRHRWFETGNGFSFEAPEHPKHIAPMTKMGRPPKDGEFMHIVGNFSGVARAKEIMQMPWTNRDGLREAIPPAYTEYIGREFMKGFLGS